MPRVAVEELIGAPPALVWSELRDIAGHVAWMADAAAIRFTSDQREGPGTAFDCETRVGPIRLLDRMVVTEWVDGRSIGVRHVGLVAGTGRFRIEPADADGTTTRCSWEEELRFPWWLGGPLGAAVAGPLVLRPLWARNLERLHAVVLARAAA